MNTTVRAIEHPDVVVVGARCAGAPTAMLLARRGHRVLALDRATFPSDTLSTHVVTPHGVAALARWGLLDEVVASGCPAIDSWSFDFGPLSLRGTPYPVEGHHASYAPRRRILDDILVRAARSAGAEVREGSNVDEVLIEDGSVVGVRAHDRDGAFEARARLVVGADGRNSHVARAVGAEAYVDRPRLQYAYFTYFEGLPVDGFEIFIRPQRGFAAAATNDGRTMVVAGWPYAEAAAYKADVEANFLATLDLAPEFAGRVRRARRLEPFQGGAVPNFLRTCHGPGWALVGDAGYTRDPITAQGIADAFLDAEGCATAAHAAFSGESLGDEAMRTWQANRDARVLPMLELTTQSATLAPPPEEMQQMLGALAQSQAGRDAFASVNCGALSPAEFFSPDFLAGLLYAA